MIYIKILKCLHVIRISFVPRKLPMCQNALKLIRISKNCRDCLMFLQGVKDGKLVLSIPCKIDI